MSAATIEAHDGGGRNRYKEREEEYEEEERREEALRLVGFLHVENLVYGLR